MHYHRIWKVYRQWCARGSRPISSFRLARVLLFLQRGLDSGLRLSTLKVQVSALSVYFQRRLAVIPQIRTFLQGVLRMQPPFAPPTEPWDLNLVLRYLQSEVFEPLQEVELKLLSWKTVMLLALASARRVS